MTRYWTRARARRLCAGDHDPADQVRFRVDDPIFVRALPGGGHLEYCAPCALSRYQEAPPAGLPALPTAPRPAFPVAVTPASESAWSDFRDRAKLARRRLADRVSGQQALALAPEHDVRMRQAGRD